MQVSVVIPVYNAERFLAAAVESALAQPETAEVLLIEDGSKDNSHAICRTLQSDIRVRLLTHPANANLGASASRNLGITSATMPFIAFLDADDTYVNGRFEKTSAVFSKYPDADGVYETIGVYYHDDDLRDKHIKRASGERTGICISVLPEDLFRVLAVGKHGHISLDGMVFKRASLDVSDLLDTSLKMGEDSDFVLRMASKLRLYGGDPEHVVTLRGVHEHNTVFQNPHAMHYRRQYLQKCIDHDFYGSRDLKACLYIVTRRVGASKGYAAFRKLGKYGLPVKLIWICAYLLRHPKVLLNLVRRIF